MSGYTYYLHDVPPGEPRTVPDQPDTPAHVLSIESVVTPGTVHTYVLLNRSETFLTAAYRWYSTGTPEQSAKDMAEIARDVQQSRGGKR